MNIVSKLTLRQMKKNKRQTLVTIIGVVISVAMVSAVAILATSFMDLLQRERIAEEGEWHVAFKDLNEEQVQAIQTDHETKKSFLSRDVGYASFDQSERDDKPYFFLKQFDEKGLKEHPIHVTEGRLPQHEGEVVLPEHIQSNGGVDFEVGDELTLEVGRRVIDDPHTPDSTTLDQTYSFRTDEGINEKIEVESTETLKVVGMMERPTWEPYWSPGYTIISNLDPLTVSSDEQANVLVTKKKVSNRIYSETEELAKELNIESYDMHDSLLQTHGVFSNLGMAQTLYIFVGIIMVIIMIGSISLIYNAFAISVSERSRQLGMLSSVGATKKQKRNAVFFEGAVIGAISIPIGFLSAMLGLAITFHFVNDKLHSIIDFSESLRVTVTPFTVILAAIVSVLTIFISTYIPARRASKISAIDAIRQSEDIKLTQKKVKTSKLVRKIFGFEAEIGLKNLKRNKKRYVATVFSLFISIVLFLTVSYFTNTLTRTVELTQEGENYDIEIQFNTNDRLSDEELGIVDEIRQLPDVTESYLIRSDMLHVELEEKYVPEAFKDIMSIEPSDDSTVPYSMMYHVLGDEELKDYAKEAGVSMEQLEATDAIHAIVINRASILDIEENKLIEAEAIDINKDEEIKLTLEDWQDDSTVDVGHITVAGFLDTFPVGITPVRNSQVVNVIISEVGYEELQSRTEELNFVLPALYSLYVNSSDPIQTGEEIGKKNYRGLHMYNTAMQNQEDEQFTFILSIFIYGFIALITLISVVNIFNTITTSIALRKREFGMLKSVGMTPNGFNKMIRYESVFYGLKALLYGLPVSVGLMYLMHLALSEGFELTFRLPWIPIGLVIVAVFLIVSVSMFYASSKLKKQNVIEALKQENM